jgi:hypothetical protein
MTSFESTLARMKGLYTYGKDINEGKKNNSYSLEHRAVAADGKTYGIIRECNKYYIKKAEAGKEAIAESYNYIGGFCNKKDYEYDSFNKALKNFELKMASINESNNGSVNISTLDPFKKCEFIVEGTEKMKNEIARQRQLMYNVAMLMEEKNEISVSRKDDTVMYDGKQPEAENGKTGAEGYEKTNANPEYTGSNVSGKINPETKGEPFSANPGKTPDQLSESCDCGESNCNCDWGSKGLPSTPGTGKADTDHNNAPFNNSVNESEDFESEMEGEDMIMEDENMEDEDIDMGMEDEDMGMEDENMEDEDMEDEDMSMEDENMEDEDMDMEDEDMEDEDMGMENKNDDILARIAELESELETLKSQINTEEDLESFDVDNDDELEITDDDSDFEYEFNDVDDSEFEDIEEPEYNEDETEESYDEEESLMEMKRRYMSSIVESVTRDFINENELNVFGKHPGYRKKPMELPTTGEDENQWGRDWNDESVYSEEPFGTKIGDSAPFNILVDTITKDVMTQLSGDAFKKKVK